MIRYMSPHDFEDVLELYCALGRDLFGHVGEQLKQRMKVHIAAHFETIFVLEINHELVGVIEYSVRKYHPLEDYVPDQEVWGYIDQMYIARKFRHQKYGTELMNAAKAALKLAGAHCVRLHSSTGAYRFYKNLGFKETRELELKL